MVWSFHKVSGIQIGDSSKTTTLVYLNATHLLLLSTREAAVPLLGMDSDSSDLKGHLIVKNVFKGLKGLVHKLPVTSELWDGGMDRNVLIDLF